MKKAFLACVLAFTGTCLFAQQDNQQFPSVPLKVRVDTGVWGLGTRNPTDNNIVRRLPQGETVIGNHLWWVNATGESMVEIIYGGNRYSIRAGDLSPAGNGRLPADWLDAPDTHMKWVTSYYLDVIRSQDRNTFRTYDPYIDDMIRKVGDDSLDGWYVQSSFLSQFESLVLLDAVAIMGGFWNEEFFITDIIPFNTGYKVKVTGTSGFAQRTGKPLYSLSMPSFPRWQERQSFDLIFIPDGDYMDVYLDTPDSHFATFAKVDETFIDVLSVLMRDNTVDTSRITSWPRRADGSTDYPPPDGTTVPDFQASQKTHGELALPIRPRDRQSRSQTTDRLRVRENPDTSSAIVTTLDTGTHVQLLETGATETIGGITAPWVKVQSENGFTGWTFSGYLETLNPETQNLDSENQERENVETQNETGEASLLGDSAAPNRHPLNQGQNLEPKPPQKAWRIGYADSPKRPAPPVSVLPFAIAGSVILVAGIVTTVVLAKRRKGRQGT